MLFFNRINIVPQWDHDITGGELMNKSGLIDALQKEAGISKAKAEQVINIFF